MTVKIKPLVWVADEDDPDCIRSGDYWIYHQGLGYQVYIWPVVFGDPHKTLAAAQEAVWQHHVAHILAAIEAPDHLALVAAAYRDATEMAAACKKKWVDEASAADTPDEKLKSVRKALGADIIKRQLSNRTPADAEAHLTALLRAEYERGKAEEQARAEKAVDRIGQARLLTDTGASLMGETMDYSPRVIDAILAHLDAALALLTQEGR